MSDEPKLSTGAKILKYIAYILMGGGLVLFMLGLSSFFFGSSPSFMDPLYMIIFGLLLLFAGMPMLVAAQQGIIKPEFDTISLVNCSAAPDCKFRRAKKFERGEYVFKTLDKKCEECGNPLYISAIFEIEKKPPSVKPGTSERKVEEPADLTEVPLKEEPKEEPKEESKKKNDEKARKGSMKTSKENKTAKASDQNKAENQ